jgi:hypothetical protein
MLTEASCGVVWEWLGEGIRYQGMGGVGVGEGEEGCGSFYTWLSEGGGLEPNFCVFDAGRFRAGSDRRVSASRIGDDGGPGVRENTGLDETDWRREVDAPGQGLLSGLRGPLAATPKDNFFEFLVCAQYRCWWLDPCR